MKSKKLTATKLAELHGFRSGLENQISNQFARINISVRYEPFWVNYMVPARRAKYKPDFVLPNGIIIESKGRFVTADRQKHLLIKEQLPGLDIRFVFSNPKERISKKSTTTYAMWCNKHGFKYATQTVPMEWIAEAVEEGRARALKQFDVSD